MAGSFILVFHCFHVSLKDLHMFCILVLFVRGEGFVSWMNLVVELALFGLNTQFISEQKCLLGTHLNMVIYWIFVVCVCVYLFTDFCSYSLVETAGKIPGHPPPKALPQKGGLRPLRRHPRLEIGCIKASMRALGFEPTCLGAEGGGGLRSCWRFQLKPNVPKRGPLPS